MSRPAVRALELLQPASRHDAVTFFHQCRIRPRIASPSRARLRISNSLRSFSTTGIRAATVIKRNPRLDEDGQEMTINISERAAKRLKQIVSTPPKKNSLVSQTTNSSPDSHLRVTVTAGGCHGFQYLMSLEGKDKVDQDEDTVFEFDEPGDVKATVLMDEPSLELLKGSTIDFTTELIGSSFKIVGNPRATSSCGCGTSFDIE